VPAEVILETIRMSKMLQDGAEGFRSIVPVRKRFEDGLIRYRKRCRQS